MELVDQRATRPDPTFSAAFNARTMTAPQVAASFVAPSFFPKLLSANNSLLSGPRGSGKTTLLKMLQREALKVWDSPDSEQILQQMSYTGVFVATDRTWKDQLLPTSRATESQVELRLAESAFTAHTLRQLIRAIAHRYSELPIAPERRNAGEREIARAIAKMAVVNPDEDTFRSLAIALSIRLNDIGTYRSLVARGDDLPQMPSWAHGECLTVAQTAIDIFKEVAEDVDHQWAFLFDELELAPTQIVESLIGAMRGQAEGIIYKLSLAPVQPELSLLNLPNTGVPGQDFEVIRLDYPRQILARNFTIALLLKSLPNDRSNLRTILGRSHLTHHDDPLDEHNFAHDAANDVAEGPSSQTDVAEGPSSQTDVAGGPSSQTDVAEGPSSQTDVAEGPSSQTEAEFYDSTPYARGSRLWSAYLELSEKDDSFKSWLAHKDIDLSALEKLTPQERASALRKVRALVVVRNFYRGDQARRSRKSYELYCGYDAVVAFLDGSPRMIRAMSDEMRRASNNYTRSLSVSAQSRAIENVMNRFMALIRAQEALLTKTGRSYGVLTILDCIGNGLARSVVIEPFNDNVALTFKVDGTLPNHVTRALQLAVNCGAIVHLPRRGGPDALRPDLVGEHFRLSYLLAPRYGIPMRLGRPVSLRQLLIEGGGQWLLDSRRGTAVHRGAQSLPGMEDPHVH